MQYQNSIEEVGIIGGSNRQNHFPWIFPWIKLLKYAGDLNSLLVGAYKSPT